MCYNSSECLSTNTTGAIFTNTEIGMIALMSITCHLLTLSTCYDLTVSGNYNVRGKKHELLKSFSLYSNGKKLLSTHVGKDVMTCLYGLRFLSMFWIIFGHTYYLKTISPIINPEILENPDPTLARMLVMNATVTTDTFFLLSGTLLCYVFMREWEKNESFNIIKFYLLRYIRLTPPYAFVIFFYATLMYRLGSGPLWESQMGRNRNLCLESWWTNLLYINNYIKVDRMCMNQTWYLAVDMQLFWFSPVVLYPLAKWPLFGKLLLGIAMLASLLIPFLITVLLRLTALMMYTKDEDSMGSVYVQIYTRTYARAGPYLIGITLGYVLYKIKGKFIDIPKVYIAIGWITAIASCLAVVLGAAVFYDDDHEYNAVESGIYAGLHRSVWALGIAWITFACVKGYGGPVNTFLSWRAFIPLGRLTYCAYLCHYIILLYNVGSMRTPAFLCEYNIVHEFAGNVVFSFVLAAIVSLSFEIPFMNIGMILFRLSNRKQQILIINGYEDEREEINSFS